MVERVPVSKKARFEVFKRDKFTCQYCGAKAPDVLLQADHIKPVAEGGLSDILNLITSCASCNSGKGARSLGDASSLDFQRKQLEDLQERREQIEMMLSWREELTKFNDDIVDIVGRQMVARTGLGPNESGRADIRRWLKRISLEDLLSAAERSFEVYLSYEGDGPTTASWNKAFNKIPAVANIAKQEAEKPYLVRLFYIQGILRKRLDNRWLKCVDALESFVLDGLPVEEIEVVAKRSDDWEDFLSRTEAALARIRASEGE